jgi:hypothetical protein
MTTTAATLAVAEEKSTQPTSSPPVPDREQQGQAETVVMLDDGAGRVRPFSLAKALLTLDAK